MSEFAKTLAFPRMHYVTDRFHGRNHVDPWCLAHCSPDVPANKEVLADTNTSVAEQQFSVLGRL